MGFVGSQQGLEKLSFEAQAKAGSEKLCLTVQCMPGVILRLVE